MITSRVRKQLLNLKYSFKSLLMRRNVKLFCLISGMMPAMLFGQTAEKVTVNGAARAVFFADELSQDLNIADTVTAPKENSGHTLVDLGVNIRPIEDIEIQGMVRVRNDFGGFWGSGITFDVRQLYVKGVIADIVRYQLGDIDYKLSPYTFYNGSEMATDHLPVLCNTVSPLVEYDLFYGKDNTWRQQGAAVDFSLLFKDFADELQFNMFTSRQQVAAGGNNERLFSGINITLLQSKFLSLGYNYVQMYDLAGTSANDHIFHNPINTITLNSDYTKGRLSFNAGGELGNSRYYYENWTESPELSDYFMDGKISVLDAKTGVGLKVAYRSVGPDFRSVAAQTKRINFDANPRAFERITNDQVIRPLTILDLTRDAALYNMRVQTSLMSFDPRYDNISPYQDATPNRQGVTIGLSMKKSTLPVSAELSYGMYTEIRGEGTTDLRNFSRILGDVQVDVNKWLENKNRLLRVAASVRMDNTDRASEGNIPAVDLQTMTASVSGEIETIDNLDIILGFYQITYSGFEFTPLRDEFGQIIYFTEYETDGSQQLYGAGLRYRFTPKIEVSAMYDKFNQQDTMSDLPAYSINTFGFIFKMDF